MSRNQTRDQRHRRPRGQLLAVAVVLASVLAWTAAASAAPKTDPYIVVVRDSANVDHIVRLHRWLGVDISFVYRNALKGYAAELTKQQLKVVGRDPRVLFVSADRGVKALAQSTPTGVRRIGGPQPAPTARVAAPVPVAGAPLGVAVIDTGIDLDHPDLGVVVPGRNCIGRNPLPDDDHGHGTHVAGTIGALDNGDGVVGVFPYARLYAVKVLDADGGGMWSNVICGIDFVTANAAHIRVANLSIGGGGSVTPSNAACLNGNNDALHMAICRSVKAGVTYVAAAGNDKKDAASAIPAAYDEVIAVSALADSDGLPGGTGGAPSCRSGEGDDRFASFSNYGSVVDIAAPGVCILSTARGGGYELRSGTSMAAPHVSGAAAYYAATHPGALPADIRAALIASQEPGPIPGDPDASKEGVVRIGALPIIDLEAPLLPELPELPEVPENPLPGGLPPLPPVG
jgi:subtilisin family serine protease